MRPPASTPSVARKLRRFWLFAPYAVLAVLALAYGGFWLFARGEVERGLETATDGLRARGYAVSIEKQRIDGFPFRLRVHLVAVRMVAPSGWGVETPALEAMAYLHDPRHWVLAAPEGLTLDRPAQTPVRIVGRAIRASVVARDPSPWRVVVEGEGLTFTPTDPIQPFPLATADRWGLYLKPGQPRSGEALMLMDLAGARAAPQSVIARIVGDSPFDAAIQARATQAGAFSGDNVAASARRWSAAGGVFSIDFDNASAESPLTRLTTDPATLRLGPDGRVQGMVGVHLVPTRGAPSDRADLNLVFANGRASLGPVRIGPSPKLY